MLSYMSSYVILCYPPFICTQLTQSNDSERGVDDCQLWMENLQLDFPGGLESSSDAFVVIQTLLAYRRTVVKYMYITLRHYHTRDI